MPDLGTIVRQRPPLSVAIVTQLVTRLGAVHLTIWMQTIGATLVVVERCSPVRTRMPAHGSRSARTLLYLAAVRDDWREHQPCRVRGPTRFQVCAPGSAQVMESVAWTALPPNLASGSGRPACQPDRWLCMSYVEKHECLCCNE
jgi:hypothetical protein